MAALQSETETSVAATAGRPSRPIGLDVAIALVAAAVVALSTTGVWIETEHHVARGYHYPTGIGSAALAGLGFILVAMLRLSHGRRTLQWISVAGLAASAAAVALVAIEIARPHEYAVYWSPRGGIWWALGFAMVWLFFSILRTFASFRGAPIRKPPGTPASRITPALVGATLTTIFLMAGAFGPWSDSQGGTLSGLSGSHRGWIGLSAAFVAVVALLTYVSVGRKAILGVVALAALLSFGAAGADRNDISNANYYVTAGWGLNVTLAAAFVLLLAALVMLVCREPSLLRARAATAAADRIPAMPAVTAAFDKICPDCAETVKAAARVCRFCGFRFDAIHDQSSTTKSFPSGV